LQYLNAKLGEAGVGKVERAIDGLRENGGSFQMQLGDMEASGKFGTAMEKYSEVMQTNSHRAANKKRRKAKEREGEDAVE
jgi:hypothetical protein